MRRDPRRARPLIAFLAVTAGGFGACRPRVSASKKPSKECLSAEQTLGHAISQRDFAKARSLRAATYATCGARPELRNEDRRLVDGEQSVALEEAAGARHRQQVAAVVAAFLDFVATERAAPEHASVQPRCGTSPAPAGTAGQAGGAAAPWCTATRQLGRSTPIEIHYAESAPQAFRFTVVVDGPLDCKAVAGTELRHWQVAQPTGGKLTLARCSLGGRLEGLSAVVSTGEPSTLHVFSPSFLEHDASSRLILDP